MIGDDGYGTWDNERLDKEYRKVKGKAKALEAENKKLWKTLEDVKREIEAGEDCEDIAWKHCRNAMRIIDKIYKEVK